MQVLEERRLEAESSPLALDVASAKIAIIDDEPLNVRMIRRQLEKLGYRFLLGITDPSEALESLRDFEPDVVLLDIVMPQLSGAELLESIRQDPQLQATPVIVLTASRDRSTRLQIIKQGVADFLGKPVDQPELSTRLRNVIEAKRYRDHLKQSAHELELAVRKRTQELEVSRREVVLCLARAAEYRDDTTGQHVRRVGRYAATLAKTMGLSADFVEMIELAAQLHDVGKIGIPDSVLHKPGKLSDDEMDVMRRHADFGRRILTSDSDGDAGCLMAACGEMQSPLLAMAARIAAGHHERWDGKGYPQGLAGESIPLEARITAVADVFDALSTWRCYKPAFPLDHCFETIAAESNRHFDGNIVAAFLASRKQFESIHREMVDEGGAS